MPSSSARSGVRVAAGASTRHLLMCTSLTGMPARSLAPLFGVEALLGSPSQESSMSGVGHGSDPP